MQLGGLGLCVLLIDRIGRRRCLWIFLMATCIFITPFLRSNKLSEGETTSGDVACLFFTRSFTYASFIALFIYTPEIYPTKIRSFAFGLYNAFSRLGGLVAPFIAIDLMEKVRAMQTTCVDCVQNWLGASEVATEVL
jgi:MFS transporter, putative metabolite:H+ symporter